MTLVFDPDKPRLMEVEAPIRVNAYDIDVAGIVHNTVYIRWFEDLRCVFLDKYYPFDEMMADGVIPVLSKTYAEYKLPLTIYDKPIGHLWMTDMARSRWEMQIEIRSERGCHCLGVQEGCAYDLSRGRPARMPDRLGKPYEEALGNL